MRYSFSLLFGLMWVYSLEADEGKISFQVAENLLPEMKAIIGVETGQPGPNQPKSRTLVEVKKYGELTPVSTKAKLDWYWLPKSGLPVKFLSNWKYDPQRTEIKLHDYLGVFYLRGESFPRPDRVILTAYDDVGPDEKGHLPIQVASEFKVPMVIPEGTYRLWIIPANGARTIKGDDRIRILAGRSVSAD